MNEPIANASLLALTASSSKAQSDKVVTRPEDKEIFREELSFASQLSNTNTSVDRSLHSDNDSSDRSNDSRSNDSRPDERERVDKPERSHKENDDREVRRQSSDESRNEVDKNEPKQSPTNDTENAADTSSQEEPISTDEVSPEVVNEDTEGNGEALLAALEASNATEEQLLQLKELLEQESAAEILAGAGIQELIGSDPAAALQLAVDTLDANLDLSSLPTGQAEELVLDEAINLVAEEVAGEEVASNQLNAKNESVEALNEVNVAALNEEASADADENLLATAQASSQSDVSNRDAKSKSNGSLDTSALEAESIDGETDDLLLPSTESKAAEVVAAQANNTTLASDSETAALPQDMTPGSERNVTGQTSNLAIDRAEAASTAAKRESRPQVDPTRFVTRVTKAFETAQSRGGGPIEIRLSPPELGSLQIRLEVKEGVLTASLETENQAARNALLDNLPALRERLAEQQIRIEKFDVDVRDESSQSDQREQQADAQNNRERREQSQTNSPRLATSTTSEEVETNEQTKSTIYFPEDGINVVA